MADVNDVLSAIVLYSARAFLIYASTVFLFPLASVYQERKIWEASPSLPSLSLYGHVKVYLFNVVWMGLCLVGAVLILPKYLLLGSAEKEGHCWVERTVAWICVRAMLGSVKIVGEENLPIENPGSPAPVYIANHASQIDVGVVYFLRRRFKWIAKKSVLYLPGVGQIMFLSGHVFIDRKTGSNKSSVANLYDKSNTAVQSGIPMFIFPQGTRRMAERLPFKDGAFNVALTNKSTLVPISIQVPLNAWTRWYPLPFGNADPIVLTIHTPIPLDGTEDKEALKKECYDTIYSVLPNIGGDDKKEQ